MPAPDTLTLLQIAAAAALDKKAFQLIALEVGELTSYADNLMICSAASQRQVAAISNEVLRQLRENGYRPLHTEGPSGSGWFLLDYGELIVHIFTEEKRSYYALDNLWGDAKQVDPELIGVTQKAPAGNP